MKNNRIDCQRSPEDCGRVMELVTLSLDGVLTDDQELALMNEIQQFPCCLQNLNIARSFKTFLCNKIQKRPVPAALVERIKSQISAIAH